MLSYKTKQFSTLLILISLSSTVAQEESNDEAQLNSVQRPLRQLAAPSKAVDEEQSKLYAKFTKLLTGAKLSGQFTVDGKPLNDLKEDTYEITKVEKLAEGDQWVITARIKYGDKDITFPVPLDVKWAGATPVLTLDNMTIPGFGTFGARIVFHKDKYAGTWQHDNVGGHMFGLIELPQESDSGGAGTVGKPVE